MKINTRDFGEIDIDENKIITFVKPILGFEEYTKFVLITDEQIGEGFAWLQSVDEAGLCFVMANSAFLDKPCNPQVDSETLDALGGKFTEQWFMAVVKNDAMEITVNLKSPVLINGENSRGAQVVSEDELPVRYPLFAGKETV